MKMAVLASGYGSNLQAIIDAIENGEINGKLEIVVSDKKDAYALERARRHHIEDHYINPKVFSVRDEFDRAVIALLQERKVDLVILAGFMRLLSPVFVNQFMGKIMNIHPSLLPSFPGLNGVEQALEYGVKVTGCTVHFLDEGLDTGPVILQDTVPVYESDTVETLHERIHSVEHRLYTRAIQLFSQGKLSIEGRKCIINEG
ncbi:MAG: phosphoribosylglycinamide formyltransferase [Bacillota bacterium]|nr:phosphoribosylglycinamide formyltransferase [Bacillota bacterium]